MSASPRRSAPARRRRASADVVSLERAQIERALTRRSRYRYVHPRVESEGTGWRIVSPNCSRRVDATGGEIDIAWFEPLGAGHWALHARDHSAHAWVLQASDLGLADALRQVCNDALGRYWP
jgi:hypothetical protein